MFHKAYGYHVYRISTVQFVLKKKDEKKTACPFNLVLPSSKCALQENVLTVEIAVENLPYPECVIQSGGLFNGEMLATCNHFEMKSILNHISKMKMPAAA